MQECKKKKTVIDSKQKKIALAGAMGILLCFLVLCFTGGKQVLEFVSQPEQFRAWVKTNGALGPLALIGIQILQVVIAFIPGEAVEIGAGYAFGAVQGMILCLIGAAAASALVVVLTRKWGMRMVEAFVPREKIQSLRFLQNVRRLHFLVFLLFLIPGTPKDVFTYFIGLTPMRLPVFLLISSVARIPSVLSSTLGGDALGIQNYSLAIVVFAATAALSAAGLGIYALMIKRNKED